MDLWSLYGIGMGEGSDTPISEQLGEKGPEQGEDAVLPDSDSKAVGELPRLHLGAGHYYWPGYINHDAEIDLWNLPYGDNSIAEIHAIHLFEHLPRLRVDAVLREWMRVLVPRGTLVLEMPSLDKMAQLILDGERNIRHTLLGIFGDPRDWDARPLMRHEWAWSNWELEAVLTNAGFAVEFAEPVFHLAKRDLRVIGRKNEY